MLGLAPFLIVETGQPARPLRRYGGFPHWIRVAAGLAPDEAVAVNVERGDELPEREGFAGAIVTGSAAMVTDGHPWSERSAGWLREAAEAGMPLFGICYGHQLLAHALGGKVGPNPAGRQMGTVPISLLPAAGEDPLFAGVPDGFPAQVTHLQAVLELPEGATALATSERDGNHAFRWGDATWGVQFHPEFSTAHMRGYLRARSDALAGEGQDPRALIREVSAAPHARGILRGFVREARRRASIV